MKSRSRLLRVVPLSVVLVAISLVPRDAHAGGVKALGFLASAFTVVMGVFVAVTILGVVGSMGAGTQASRSPAWLLRVVSRIIGVLATVLGGVVGFGALLLESNVAGVGLVLLLFGVGALFASRTPPTRDPALLPKVLEEALAAESRASHHGSVGRLAEAKIERRKAALLREEATRMEAAAASQQPDRPKSR